ncbi:hypothetical protein ELZ38_09910 [Enterococcus faecalis]|nr:hypothetical protein [Enterococcus faecalis]
MSRTFLKKFFKLFCSVVVVCCDNFYILSSRLLFVNNFFVVFQTFSERFETKNCYLIIDF